MQIADNTVVSIHYTLKNSAGDVIDSSQGGDPLTYLHGAGNIIPGLESALVGKSSGDKLDVTVAPQDAYGERREEMMQSVARAEFGDVDDLQIGMRFRAETPAGHQIFTITAIDDEQVTVDANHPLAGETLFFSVEVIDLRSATEEEIDHGHVHDGDHHH